MKSRVLHPALILSFIAAGAQTAGAQTTVRNVDWQPFFGCWQASGAQAEEMLCIVADGPAVRMVTLVDGAVRADTRIVADGQTRRNDVDGCTNQESARWSRDHRRVFLASDVRCPDGATRSVRGMLTFVSPDEWLSVQTVNSSDGTATRTVRFTPVEGVRIPGTIAGALRNSPLTRVSAYEEVDEADVLEAAKYIDAGAIDEWMRVTDSPYRLGEGRSNSISALDQMDRMSQDVRYADPEVVYVDRPVYYERPVYVVRSYGRRAYSWWWTPWGYDHFSWYGAGPYVHVQFPIVIHVGSHGWGYHDRWRHSRYYYGRDHGRGWGHDYGRDYGRGRDRDWDRDRGGHGRDDHGRERSRDGRVTREGYTRDRSASTSQPARAMVPRGPSRSNVQPYRPPTTTPTTTRTTRSAISRTPTRTMDQPTRSRETSTRSSTPRSSTTRSSTPRSSTTRSSEPRSSTTRSAVSRTAQPRSRSAH